LLKRNSQIATAARLHQEAPNHSRLPEIDSRFVVVPRLRGQRLKDQTQLDGWLRDGSAAYVESLCDWK
jgi:hypothetical protein